MTRPDPHDSYREPVSSGAEAVEKDAPEAAIFRSIRFIRETLAGADTTSLPIDYSVERMAQDRMADIESLRAQLATAYERCAKIADPWPGFNVGQKIQDPDYSVIEVRTKIAAAIRALNSGEQKQSNQDLDHPGSGPPVYGKKEDLIQGTTADASPSSGHPGTESTGGAA